MTLKNIALLVSVILHPLLLPTLVCTVVFYGISLEALLVPENAKPLVLLMIFMMTFVAPALGILLYYFTGSIKSLTMQDRKDRFYPFVLTTGIYVGFTFLLATSEGSIFIFLNLLVSFLAGVSATLIVITFVTFYWQISAHGAGIAGVVGFWFALACRYQQTELMYAFVITLFLMGLLLSCRLYLNAHNPAQIWAGVGVGFIINFSTVLWTIL
jgi:hypothetical protein